MVLLHVFRNVLLANQDSESVVPDIQQLSDLTEIGNNFVLVIKILWKV